MLPDQRCECFFVPGTSAPEELTICHALYFQIYGLDPRGQVDIPAFIKNIQEGG